MTDQLGLIRSDSDAVVPHSSSNDSPSPVVFELGRLPLELRAKVIIASIDSDWDHTDVLRLSLVSFEFSQVVAPSKWWIVYLRLKFDGTEQRLRSFAESMSPIHGSLVQHVRLTEESFKQEALGHEVRTLLARILTDLPNVNSLELRFTDLCHDIIANSLDLNLLTHLSVTLGVGSTTLAAIISRCHNLVDVDLDHVTSEPDERPRLIAALASRRQLKTLTIESCDLIERLSSADWECPLKTIKLQFPCNTPQISLLNLHAFLSHFSSTLVDLVVGPARSQHLTHLDPFPLPRLVNLSLDACRPEAILDLLGLFASSPLKNVFLDELSPDATSVETLERFIRSHKKVHGTLERMDVDPVHPCMDAEEEHRVRGLVREAEALGIDMRFAGQQTPLVNPREDEFDGEEREEEHGEEEEHEEENNDADNSDE